MSAPRRGAGPGRADSLGGEPGRAEPGHAGRRQVLRRRSGRPEGEPATERGGAWRAVRAARDARIELQLGRSMPGWALRLTLAAVTVAVLVVAGLLPLRAASAPDVAAVATGAVLVLALVVVLRPGGLAVTVLVLAVGLGTLATADGISGRTFALVLLVHLLVRLAAVAELVPGRMRVELAVLGAQLREVAVVQVGVQSLTLVAAVAERAAGAAAGRRAGQVVGDAAGAGAGDAWLRVLAVAGVLTVVALLVPRTWRTRRA